MSRRVYLQPAAPAQRRGSRRRRGLRTRALPASLRSKSWRVVDTVSQYGADVPGDDCGGHRPAHWYLRGSSRRISLDASQPYNTTIDLIALLPADPWETPSVSTDSIKLTKRKL